MQPSASGMHIAHCWVPGAHPNQEGFSTPFQQHRMLGGISASCPLFCSGLMPTLGDWMGLLASVTLSDDGMMWGSGLWAF
eukprot:1321251-Ditylum_brightwellii.AAC.2